MFKQKSAKGDVIAHGIVEAATIDAGGSVYISDGFAGMQKGIVHAVENVNIGYINQGKVHAGNNIHVERSIMHSVCVAKNSITCTHGNIIGGFLSADCKLMQKISVIV